MGASDVRMRCRAGRLEEVRKRKRGMRGILNSPLYHLRFVILVSTAAAVVVVAVAEIRGRRLRDSASDLSATFLLLSSCGSSLFFFFSCLAPPPSSSPPDMYGIRRMPNLPLPAAHYPLPTRAHCLASQLRRGSFCRRYGKGSASHEEEAEEE